MKDEWRIGFDAPLQGRPSTCVTTSAHHDHSLQRVAELACDHQRYRDSITVDGYTLTTVIGDHSTVAAFIFVERTP